MKVTPEEYAENRREAKKIHIPQKMANDVLGFLAILAGGIILCILFNLH